MTSPAAIRQAEPDDIPLLARTRLDFLQALGYQVRDEDAAEAREQIESFLKAQLGNQIFAWLAFVDGQLASVGFLQTFTIMHHPAARTGRYGRIINMYTLPDYQRQGLARAIMERLISQARDLKLDYIGLDASPDGRHLYDSLGFVEQHPKHPPMMLSL